MSRHRNVRSMNYEEDFYEDDDYLGHSVEDNYCISPGTAAQFTFNRDKNVDLSHYMEEGIPEENEEDSDGDSLSHSSSGARLQLDESGQAKLNSCLDEIRNVIGDTCPEHVMAQTVVRNNYNIQATLNELLNQAEVPKPQRQPRESRRNRSQGDDDDFDDFLQSLNQDSPKMTPLSDNVKQSLGIMKYGSWSSESSVENLRNVCSQKCKVRNYTSAGSSECLSSTPDTYDMGEKTKREKYPSTGSSDCFSTTPDECFPIQVEFSQNQLKHSKTSDQACQTTSNTQPSLSQLANLHLTSSRQQTLSELSHQNSASKGPHADQPKLANQHISSSGQQSVSQTSEEGSSMQPSLCKLANQNMSSKQSPLSQLANQTPSTLSQLASKSAVSSNQPYLSMFAHQTTLPTSQSGVKEIQNESKVCRSKDNLNEEENSRESLSDLEDKISNIGISRSAKENSSKRSILESKESSLKECTKQSTGQNISPLSPKHSDQPISLSEIANTQRGGKQKQVSLADIASSYTMQNQEGKSEDLSFNKIKQLSLADIAKENSSSNVNTPSLSDLAIKNTSGSDKQPSLADLAIKNTSGSDKQPSLADLAIKNMSESDKQPSLADLVNKQLVGTGKQLSLTELTNKQSSRTGKQPSLADLAKTKSNGTSGMANKQSSETPLADIGNKQSSEIAKQPSLADIAGVQSSKITKQPSLAELTSKTKKADVILKRESGNQNDGKIHSKSLSGISDNQNSRNKSLKVKQEVTTQGHNLVSDLSGLKISKNTDSKISLTDLAGKKPEKAASMKASTTEVREPIVQSQKSVEGEGHQSPIEVFTEEIAADIEYNLLKLKASYLGQVLCLHDVRYKTYKNSLKKKWLKFSYVYQRKDVKTSGSVMQKIVPFDFSTPSPDDIVRSKQKAAFTRTGEKK